MSEGTTKPNGGREMKVETTDDVKRRIEDAGYNFNVNALQAHFSQQKVQESSGNNSGSSDTAKPTKAGDHTLVTNKATIAFKPLIPYIADGAKTTLKGKAKTANKATRKTTTQRPNKSTGQKPTADRHDDRI